MLAYAGSMRRRGKLEGDVVCFGGIAICDGEGDTDSAIPNVGIGDKVSRIDSQLLASLDGSDVEMNPGSISPFRAVFPEYPHVGRWVSCNMCRRIAANVMDGHCAERCEVLGCEQTIP